MTVKWMRYYMVEEAIRVNIKQWDANKWKTNENVKMVYTDEDEGESYDDEKGNT